ncbi:Alpha/Beta hydrolase protein [Globomyces pollinis-pini]|nr:Alpha/Beta hydrolase protein [Globomyces pollinis-pini]
MDTIVFRMICFLFLLPLTTVGLVAGEVNTLKWINCGDEKEPTLECSTLLVPMDYANPSSKLIQIALNRKPAPIQPAKLSLLFNPGGPGGSGLDLVKGFNSSYYNNVVDYIGFDPRGVGKSQSVACAETPADWQTYLRDSSLFGVDYVPQAATPEQIAVYAAYSELTSQSCLKHSGELIYHITTPYVCRDMDEIRKALGMKKMNYMGFSYGTVLGNTYANMFPDNVGRMILDGVANPFEYYGSVFNFLNGLVDTEVTVEEFANACDQVTSAECPLSKEGSEFGFTALQTIYSVIENLKTKPLLVHQTSVPAVVTSEMASKVLFMNIYKVPKYLEIATAFYQASKGNGYPMSTLHDRTFNMTEVKESRAIGDSFAAIICSDTDISSTKYSVAEWFEQVKYHENTVSRLASRQWGWQLLVCRTWPRSPKTEHYKGPWNKKFNFPIMIVGNTYDPVTPFKSARNLYEMMNEGHAKDSNAVLVHHNGHGHCSTTQESTCTRQYQIDYVLHGILPPPNAVCEPDSSLFTKPKVQRLSFNNFKSTSFL